MPQGKPKHPILIVDDEPEMLHSLRDLLRYEFEVHTAGSGAEALDLLKEQPIHLIMTDQRMPEMSGVEVLRQVKCEYPAAIRVIFTGYADTTALVDAINQGNVYRFVAKPWDPEELQHTLREACVAYDRIVDRRRLMRELRAYEEQCQLLDDGLRAGELGKLTDDGRRRVDELALTGRTLIARLDRALADDKCVPIV